MQHKKRKRNEIKTDQRARRRASTIPQFRERAWLFNFLEGESLGAIARKGTLDTPVAYLDDL
jgi:hypothetical protein